MPLFRSDVEGYNRKAGANFTQEYTPAKVDTVTNTLIPITAYTDNVSTIVQNIPLANEGAFCPKRGELVKFVAGGVITAGDSLGLAVGANPTCWELVPIVVNPLPTAGVLTRRIGIAEESVATNGNIGLMQYTNDDVYV